MTDEELILAALSEFPARLPEACYSRHSMVYRATEELLSRSAGFFLEGTRISEGIRNYTLAKDYVAEAVRHDLMPGAAKEFLDQQDAGVWDAVRRGDNITVSRLVTSVNSTLYSMGLFFLADCLQRRGGQ